MLSDKSNSSWEEENGFKQGAENLENLQLLLSEARTYLTKKKRQPRQVQGLTGPSSCDR